MSSELRLKVATVWRGEWCAEVAYNVLDEVSFSAEAEGVKRGNYRSLLAANREPLSNENAWVLVLDLEKTQSATEDAEAMNEGFADAESKRVEAENKRVTAENSRVEAESKRASEESGRVEAESKRVTAESGRVEAESNRRTAEEERIRNEQARVSAESGRVESENKRVSDEQARESAEKGRVAAESNRATAFANAQNERVEAFAKAEAGRDAVIAGKVGDITRLQGEVVKKANIDGYYSSMAVGAAESLIGQNVTTQQFTYQPTGNTLDVQDGLAVIKSIKGNTVVMNQLFLYKETIYSREYLYCYTQKAISFKHRYLIKFNYTNSLFSSATIGFSLGGNLYGESKSFPLTIGNGCFSSILTSNNATNLSLFFAFKDTPSPESFNVDPNSICFIDLTKMFGAGNEPATVEEFEWLYPNLPTDYNEGSLLNLNAEGIKSVDANGVKEDVVGLPIKQHFLDGMKAIGNIRDEIVWIDDAKKYKVIQRIGSRAYQTGDEEVAELRTDKMNTYYILESPVESFIDDELIKYEVWNEGTEEIVSDEPTTPIIIDVIYGVNAVDTLNRLPQKYISVESMRGFLAQLGSVTGGSWTMSYDEVNSKWVFAFTANAVATNEE